MFDYLKELMLREYFCGEITIGRFIEDKKPLFTVLGHIFLLNEDEIDRLFTIVQSQEVKEILSLQDYHEYRRINQYFKAAETKHKTNKEVEEIIDLKGNSIALSMKYEMLNKHQFTSISALENFTQAAESGIIPAMHLFGILLIEGIAFNKDVNRGKRLIHKAANWNSEEGLLASIYYDEKNRLKYLYCLRERLSRLGYSNVFNKIEKVYGNNKGEVSKEFLILELAFGKKIVERKIYDRSYARLLYSHMLSNPEKKNLLLNQNKEIYIYASALPLNLSKDFCEYNLEGLDLLLSSRVEDKKKISLALSDIDKRTTLTYRPLCFVSNSNYLLKTYASCLSKCLKNAHIERIEVSDLSGYDLDSSNNNIFIRNCDEDESNVYFLFLRGLISNDLFNIIDNFLLTTHRQKFRLNHPGITLDLSTILPICFCNKEHAKKIQDVCNVIEIADPSSQEKLELIKSIIEHKRLLYKIDKISIDDEVSKELIKFNIDNIETLLDKAISQHRENTLILTEDLMRTYIKEANNRHTSFGFGGIN